MMYSSWFDNLTLVGIHPQDLGDQTASQLDGLHGATRRHQVCLGVATCPDELRLHSKERLKAEHPILSHRTPLLQLIRQVGGQVSHHAPAPRAQVVVQKFLIIPHLLTQVLQVLCIPRISTEMAYATNGNERQRVAIPDNA
jgi:hypothetical protein